MARKPFALLAALGLLLPALAASAWVIAFTGPTAKVSGPNSDGTLATWNLRQEQGYSKSAGSGPYSGSYYYNWSDPNSCKVVWTVLNYNGAKVWHRSLLYSNNHPSGTRIIWQSCPQDDMDWFAWPIHFEHQTQWWNWTPSPGGAWELSTYPVYTRVQTKSATSSPVAAEVALN
jgi:hypothetical protein